METMEIRKDPRGVDVGEAAIVMAIGIMVDRISRLSEQDKQDLFELVKALGAAKNLEEVDGIRAAMLEILEQQPATVQAMDLQATCTRPEKVQKWVDFISGRIRELRKQREWTQEQLAKASDLPQSHISRLEQGQHSPSSHTLQKLAKAFDIPLSQLDPSA